MVGASLTVNTSKSLEEIGVEEEGRRDPVMVVLIMEKDLQRGPPPPASASKEGSSAKKNAAKNRSKSPKGRHSHGSRHGPKTPKPAADMCVIVNSVYLWDVAKKHEDEDDEHQDSYHRRHHLHHYHQQVAPYHFAENMCLE